MSMQAREDGVFSLRHEYNYDVDAVSRETGLKCEDESLAVQSDAIDADINVMMERMGVTGKVPVSVRVPQYGDFTEAISDYRTAVEAIAMAEDSFMSMPAKVRAEFENDPQKFLEFCSVEANLPRMRELGLAVPKSDATPAAPAVPPAA